MDTSTLKSILLEEMQGYAGEGLNAHSLLTQNELEQTYAVIDYADVRGKQIVSTVLVARIVGEQIVIDVDRNNKMLVDALLARGIPEEQIVRAYLQDRVTAT